MDKLKMMSMDKVQENIQKIRELFPNAVTEVLRDGEPTLAVDFEVLKQELASTLVDDRELRYQFTWPDKQRAILNANTPISATLRPVKNDETTPTGKDSNGTPYCSTGSVNFDNTQNLYIEGDNLDVLKLLRGTYLGKIKMIYIDPPYNTGSDFVYNDDFAQDSDEYLENSGQYDGQGNRLVKNLESNGRFHTDWLNMIYPRLRLARDLLSDDGVIFISIDGNEQENIKKICDEIYGSDNCLGTIANINNPKGRSDDKYIATAHEYLFVYAQNINSVTWSGFEPTEKITKRYNKINDNGNAYREIDLRKTGENDLREDRPNLFYYFYFNEVTSDFYPDNEDNEIEGYIQIKPLRDDGREGNWRWEIGTARARIGELVPKFMPKRKIWGVMQKDYLEGRALVKPTSAWAYKDVNSERGTEEFVNLNFDKRIFAKPKPVGTLKRCVLLGAQKDSIILDFFSGAATTAHAVMQLNAEDGGKRKFIMVQLPEVCDEKSEAYKAGYKNICEIGKERIRRAGKKFKQSNTRRDIYIKAITETVGIKRLEANLSSYAYEVEEKYIENENAPEVQDDYVYNHIIDIINEETPRDSDELLFEKYYNEINNMVVKLSQLLCGLIYSVDTGFRVLKLDSTNMKDVYYKPEQYEQSFLDALEDNIKEDRTPLDLLFQVMLELGKPLSAKIEEKEIVGKKVFMVDGNDFIACFDNDVTDVVVKTIAQLKPSYVAFRNSSIADDTTAANFDQIFETYSPNTTRKVL